jgi:class 3 adenylate cyclase
MFSDLVGSTALSARMDPEDLREVTSAYQKCVAKTVRRFGGFVAKYMGDGVLVYFGYPRRMRTMPSGRPALDRAEARRFGDTAPEHLQRHPCASGTGFRVTVSKYCGIHRAGRRAGNAVDSKPGLFEQAIENAPSERPM